MCRLHMLAACSPPNVSADLPLPCMQPTYGYVMPQYRLGSVRSLLDDICYRQVLCSPGAATPLHGRRLQLAVQHVHGMRFAAVAGCTVAAAAVSRCTSATMHCRRASEEVQRKFLSPAFISGALTVLGLFTLPCAAVFGVLSWRFTVAGSIRWAQPCRRSALR